MSSISAPALEIRHLNKVPFLITRSHGAFVRTLSIRKLPVHLFRRPSSQPRWLPLPFFLVPFTTRISSMPWRGLVVHPRGGQGSAKRLHHYARFSSYTLSSLFSFADFLSHLDYHVLHFDTKEIIVKFCSGRP